MVEVVALETRPAKINKEVIEILREVLADAEKGEIQAIAIASVDQKGGSRIDVSKNDCFHALLGSVELMRHRMCARHIGMDI